MKYQVLLVDDERIILEGFRKLFDWEKYRCEISGTAMDGDEAVIMADDIGPDIVVIDINLPICSGLEAFQRMKEKNPSVHGIIVSGYDDFTYCQSALRMSLDDYILKPVDYEVFGKVIQKTIERIDQERAGEFFHSEEEDQGTVQNMLRWIHEHYMDDISLEILSRQFHLNESYISQLIKHKTGKNYSAYLAKIRFEKARTMLRMSDKSISEIAEKVGYSDYRAFTRAYKAYMGVLPSHDRGFK